MRFGFTDKPCWELFGGDIVRPELVPVQMGGCGKAFVTHATLVGLVACVRVDVSVEVPRGVEPLLAYVTLIRPLTGVSPYVSVQMVRVKERLPTILTLVLSLAGVSLVVSTQMKSVFEYTVTFSARVLGTVQSFYHRSLRAGSCGVMNCTS